MQMGAGRLPMRNHESLKHHSAEKVWNVPFLVGIASLLWFLIRTGAKPRRAAYPCQKAALANASAWLGTLALPEFFRRPETAIGREARRLGSARVRFALLLLASAAVAGIAGPAVRFFSNVSSNPAGQFTALNLIGRRQPTSTFSDIYAVQGTTGADGGFQRLVQLMEQRGQPFYALIDRNDVIIIKVNSQWDQRGGTNTDLVRAIIEIILAHPGGFDGEIVIADNGQAQYGAAGRGGDLDWKSNNAEDRTQSMQKVADRFSKEHRVSTALWDRITMTPVGEYSDGDTRDGYIVASSASAATGIVVSYPKFKTLYGTRISFKKGIWNPVSRSYDSDRLKVINVPVLKTHSIYGVTASVKHYMGVTSDRLTKHAAHGSVGSGGMGTQMAETRFPVLNVLDAIWINAVPGGGPLTRYAEATRTNIVAASRDPVALDYWAAKSILVPAAEKLGYRNMESMNPDNVQTRSFGKWLRLSMKALQDAGYPSTLDLSKINITVSSLEDFKVE
jgi:hypothetical protein